MKLVRSFTLALGLSALAGTTAAQSSTISFNLANSWAILTNQSSNGQLVSQTIPGQGSDVLNLAALSFTNIGPGNHTQGTVSGIRTGNIAMSGSVSAGSFGFMTFSWNGPGTGTAAATADSFASGQLPPIITDPDLPPMAPKINMSGSATATITIGIFGGGPSVSSTSSAVVTAPAVFPGGVGAVNRLTKTQGPPVSQNVQALAYFYSSNGSAGAQASLKKGDNAFFVTDVVLTATLNLF